MDNSKGETARNDDLRNTLGDENAFDDDSERSGDAKGGGEAMSVNTTESSQATGRKSGFASWMPNKKTEEPASEVV